MQTLQPHGCLASCQKTSTEHQSGILASLQNAVLSVNGVGPYRLPRPLLTWLWLILTSILQLINEFRYGGKDRLQFHFTFILLQRLESVAYLTPRICGVRVRVIKSKKSETEWKSTFALVNGHGNKSIRYLSRTEVYIVQSYAQATLVLDKEERRNKRNMFTSGGVLMLSSLFIEVQVNVSTHILQCQLDLVQAEGTPYEVYIWNHKRTYSQGGQHGNYTLIITGWNKSQNSELFHVEGSSWILTPCCLLHPV
ncbi:hypothetical protein J6590_034194 [Homalodisca vitripennis]|nr:hypothetical protein J6590_034194 [Homalodisca vitripennis]